MLTVNGKPFFVVKQILDQSQLVKEGRIKPGNVLIDGEEYCQVLAILKAITPDGDLTKLVNQAKELAIERIKSNRSSRIYKWL